MAINRYKFKKTLAYNNRAMANIRSKIESNQRLLTLIRSDLPANLAPYIVGCTLKNDRLFIYTESATWATKLRFHANNILQNFNRSQQLAISRVVVRITTSETQYKERKRQPKKPASISIAAIQSSAHGTNGDLQKALLKLTKTLLSKLT